MVLYNTALYVITLLLVCDSGSLGNEKYCAHPPAGVGGDVSMLFVVVIQCIGIEIIKIMAWRLRVTDWEESKGCTWIYIVPSHFP